MRSALLFCCQLLVLCRCWLLSEAATATTELVFHVPDVLVRHDAAPGRPVGTGPHDSATRRPAHGRWDAASRHEPQDVQYEEFFVEHEISTVDAKASARDLRVDDIPPSKPGCGVCSRRDLDYCESRVLADHCCCDHRYREPYPWLPHTCYIGPEPCKTLARDCGRYSRLRACCCDRILADKWKAILASSPKNAASWLVTLSTLLLLRSLL